MELIRFDPQDAIPLEGGTNATYVPIKSGERLAAMVLQLDRKGDTGKRTVAADVMLIAISGEGRMRSGGQIADLRAGDIALLPGGIMHHIWTADSTLQAILVVMPVKA